MTSPAVPATLLSEEGRALAKHKIQRFLIFFFSLRQRVSLQTAVQRSRCAVTAEKVLLDEEEETACLSSNLSVKLVFCGATRCQAEGKSSRLTEERVGPGPNGKRERFHSRNMEVWLSKAKRPRAAIVFSHSHARRRQHSKRLQRSICC